MPRKKKVDVIGRKERAAELRQEIIDLLEEEDGRSPYDLYLLLRDKWKDKYLYEKIAKAMKKMSEDGKLTRKQTESPYAGMKVRNVYFIK